MNYQSKKENFTQMGKEKYESIFIDDKDWVIPVTLSKKVEDKIIYLTRRFFDVEWSGLLFYKFTGKIEDKTLEIFAEDILTMDVGTQAHTGFKLDDRFIDYMMENPEAVDMKYGLIHSHNNMSVFFSGEDLSELQDNAPNHNFYLSVIVNNKLDVIGKVVTQVDFKSTLVGQDVTALNAEGVPYVVFKKDFALAYSRILSRDCAISFGEEVYSFEKDFASKIDTLEEFCKPKTPTTYYNPKGDVFAEHYEKLEQKVEKTYEDLRVYLLDSFCSFFEVVPPSKGATVFSRVFNVICNEHSFKSMTQELIEEFIFTLPSTISPIQARSIISKQIKAHMEKTKNKNQKDKLSKVLKLLI